MPDTATGVLAAIVGATRRSLEHRKLQTPRQELERRAASIPGKRGLLSAALKDGSWPRVIAECKRRSPSRGVLRDAYNPAELAQSYAAGGAAAVSVLTEPAFFDGAPAHLEAVRRAVSVPLLRKDFIVDPYQLVESRAWGADAVLLIASALPGRELETLLRAACDIELDVLVEVHDEAELDRALEAGAEVIGVNNRDLRTLAVDTSVSRRLGLRLPPNVIGVAESGLRTGADLQQLAELGYKAFLIGERLMLAADPGAALRELRADAVEARR